MHLCTIVGRTVPVRAVLRRSVQGCAVLAICSLARAYTWIGQTDSQLIARRDSQSLSPIAMGLGSGMAGHIISEDHARAISRSGVNRRFWHLHICQPTVKNLTIVKRLTVCPVLHGFCDRRLL